MPGLVWQDVGRLIVCISPKNPILVYLATFLLPFIVLSPQGEGEGSLKVERYSCSTLSLAHGVRRKNFNEDLTEGLLLKQLMLTCCASPPHPKCPSSRVMTFSKVIPCNGLLG